MLEELDKLKKDILSARHIKEVLDGHIKDLSSEELRYIEEIPVYKQQANNEFLAAQEASKQAEVLRQEVSKWGNELSKIKELVLDQEMILSASKIAQENIEKECAFKKSNILQIENNVKSRELAVQDRERKCSEKELSLILRDENIFRDESEVNKKLKEIELKNKALEEKLETHKNNVDLHNKKVDALIESKELHMQDEVILDDKLAKVSILIKQNVELKQSLLLQADKLSKEISITQNKQLFLDKSLSDLKNQENALKIKELKLTKMAHDKGLEQELKDLQEQLK